MRLLVSSILHMIEATLLHDKVASFTVWGSFRDWKEPFSVMFFMIGDRTYASSVLRFSLQSHNSVPIGASSGSQYLPLHFPYNMLNYRSEQQQLSERWIYHSISFRFDSLRAC